MKIMLLGWYHNLNFGDDLMRSAYEYALGELTAPKYPTVEEILSHDLLLIGGGNIHAGHVFYERWPEILEQIPADFPIVAHGISLNGKLYPSTACLLRRATVACRTDWDVELLMEHGIRSARCVDPAYLLPPLRCPPNGKALLIPNWTVSEGEWAGEYTVVNFHYPHDEEASRYLGYPYVSYRGDIQEIRELVSGARAAVTMRKHGVILCAIEGVPCHAVICEGQEVGRFLAEEAGVGFDGFRTPRVDFYDRAHRELGDLISSATLARSLS